MKIDLQPFCSSNEPEDERMDLRQPLRVGPAALASDGRRMVELFDAEDAAGGLVALDTSKLSIETIQQVFRAYYQAGDWFDLPVAEDCDGCENTGAVRETCGSCGSGVVDECCPTCQRALECSACGGNGYIVVSCESCLVTLGGARFNGAWVRQFGSLPNVQCIVHETDFYRTPQKVLYVRFSGGRGALMPSDGALEEADEEVMLRPMRRKLIRPKTS